MVKGSGHKEERNMRMGRLEDKTVIVRAVIADGGGTFSHTAIVGREYGVPRLAKGMTKEWRGF